MTVDVSTTPLLAIARQLSAVVDEGQAIRGSCSSLPCPSRTTESQLPLLSKKKKIDPTGEVKLTGGVAKSLAKWLLRAVGQEVLPQDTISYSNTHGYGPITPSS